MRDMQKLMRFLDLLAGSGIKILKSDKKKLSVRPLPQAFGTICGPTPPHYDIGLHKYDSPEGFGG